MIDGFSGEYNFLSNFYPVTIFWKGNKFPTVEHAYVASKSLDPNFWHRIAMLGPGHVGKAKKLGKTIKLRQDWNQVKLQLMEEFLRQKFSGNNLRMKLLSTLPHQLVEGNYWHDNYWGDCACNRCIDILGKNMLGELLMKIRGEIDEDSRNGGPTQRFQISKQNNQ